MRTRYLVGCLALSLGLTAVAAIEPAASIPLLTAPIQGLKPSDVRDMFQEIHNGHTHEAIDIMEPRGTPIHAVRDGVIRKLFLSKPGGITIYLVDDAAPYCYYFAHLDRYQDGLKEGLHVKRGDVIGYVGTTGNAAANAPHLHFAISTLGPEREWWKGVPVNPYQAVLEAAKRPPVR